MPIIKTGISIERELFKKAEETAAKLNVSRSKLFQLALENYIRQFENYALLESLNISYSGNISEEEHDFQKLMKTYIKNHLEDRWQ